MKDVNSILVPVIAIMGLLLLFSLYWNYQTEQKYSRISKGIVEQSTVDFELFCKGVGGEFTFSNSNVIGGQVCCSIPGVGVCRAKEFHPENYPNP